MTRVCFDNGADLVVVSPPEDWKFQGSSRTVTVSNSEFSRCSITLNLLTKGLFNLDPEGKKVFKEDVLAHVDKLATELTIASERDNPVSLNQWTGYGIDLLYKIEGLMIAKSVFFIQVDEQTDMQVTITGPESEFAAPQQIAGMIFSTWHKVKK